jgi:hypothetical protein
MPERTNVIYKKEKENEKKRKGVYVFYLWNILEYPKIISQHYPLSLFHVLHFVPIIRCDK